MKDDLMLVLTIYEGQGLVPREGWRIVVMALLDGNLQSSDPIPLTSCPKFNLEITWDLSASTLRRFKQNRVAVKVECLAVDDEGSRHKLGYIILHLNTAVKGILTEARWHKLLGESPGPHKMTSALQLSLNVISSTTAAQGGVRADEESIMEVDPIPRTSPRTSSGAQSQNTQFLHAINSLAAGQEVTVVSAGRRVGGGAGQHSGQSPRENEMNVEGVRTRGYSQRVGRGHTHLDQAGRKMLRLSNEEVEVEEVREMEEVEEVREVEEVVIPGGNSEFNLRSRTRTLMATSPHSQRSHTQSPATSLSPHTPRSFNCSVEVGVHPQSSPDNLRKRYTSRTTQGTSLACPVRENGVPAGRQRLRTHNGNNGDMPVALPGPSTARPSSDSPIVVPRLNEKGGFFQIGPAGEPNEQTFHFSVIIVYAKYLDQVVPSEVSSVDGPGVRFCYSLLGHVVHTDTIKDLSNPDFLAERAGGKVLATAANVRQYFTQHPQLPIHLLLGDVCLATASVDLAQFGQDMLHQDGPMVVEGQHPLVPVMSDPLAHRPTQQPLLGVTVTLTITPKEEPQIYHPPALRDTLGSGASLIMVDHLSSVSDSSASDSEEDWMDGRDAVRRRKKLPGYKNSVVRSGQKLTDAATSFGHKKKGLMYEAAMEVETWKEGQQQVFWQQWGAREAELQRHLSDEWENRVSQAEMHLHQRLDQCQVLHRRLTDAILHVDSMERSVSLREEKVQTEEEDVAQRKKEVKALRRQLNSRTEKGRREREAMEIGSLKQQVIHERQHRRQLQRQVRELEAANRTASRTAVATKLGGQVKDEEIDALKREKDQLSEELREIGKKKQLYKMQWVKATAQLHQVLSDTHCHQSYQPHQSHPLRLDIHERAASPPLFVHPGPTSSTTKSLEYKKENHVDGGRTTRRSLRQNSEVQVKVELEEELSEQESHCRKDSKPGKSTEPRQLVADLVKERQELGRLVRKRGSQDDDDVFSLHTFVQEAQKKIRSLDDR